MYRLLVAEISAQRGELDLAVEQYLAAAQESRDPQVAERATRIAAFAQRLGQALQGGLLWVELDPENPDAYRIVAPLLLAFGRAPEAVEHFKHLIDLSADEEDHSYGHIALQLSREGNTVAVMAVMEELVKYQADNPYAWYSQAQLAMRKNKLDLALSSVDEALNLRGHWPAAVILRARILTQQGERDKAIEFLAKQRKGKLSKDASVGLEYARTLAEAGRLQEAREQFSILTRQQPDNPDLHYAAGVLSLQFNALDVAEKHFKQVLKLGQRTQDATYYLGRVYEQQGRNRAAIKQYYLVRSNEYYFDAQLRVANLLAKEGELGDALDHIHSIRVTSTEQQLRLYLLEGEILHEAGKYQQAVDFYTGVLEEYPDSMSLRYARAIVAEKLNDLEMVENDLLYIIEREPANAQALNALGYTLANRTNRFHEALDYIERALAVEPGDGVIIDSLGWVQYRLGNLSKAEEYLRRAMELIDDPEVAAHLGEVLWMMGNKQDAMKVWRDSLKAHPNHKTLRSVMKRFGL